MSSNKISIPYFKEKAVVSIMIAWQFFFALILYDMSRDFQPPLNPLILSLIFIPMFIGLMTLTTIGYTRSSKTD